MGSTPLATILASTLSRSRKKLIMASVKANVLYAWFFASKRVETEDGGRDITNPITLGRNPNITSMQYYDQIPVAQTNEFDTLSYGWARVVGTVIISEQEQDENKGETMIFKLMKAKMEVLEESIKEKFSSYLYGAGVGTDPNGLAILVPDDPTVGTLAGMSRATQIQWRNSSYDFTGQIDSTTIEEALDDIIMDLKSKDDKPDIILMGRNWYRTYKAAIRDKVTMPFAANANGKRMIDLGFDGVSHEGVTIMFDEDCPVNKMYVLNSKYLRLHMLKGVNMRVKNLNSPWDMDAVGNRITWQGQLCNWKQYRTHAVAVM